MANPTWPETLPQFVEVEGHSETMPDTLLRTEMDVGPAKVRRRSTAAVRPVAVSIQCDADQIATLDAFVRDDLRDGALPFDWLLPRTQATVTFRFVRPPLWRPITAGVLWLAVLELEVMP